MSKKAVIQEAMLTLALRVGYRRLAIEAVAAEAGCSPNLVRYYFGPPSGYAIVAMTLAVERENAPIVAQGLLNNDAIARRAPDELKQAAADAVYCGV